MSETTPPRARKPNRITDARLGARGVLAQALLEQGVSIRNVRKATGISMTTALAMKRQNSIPREHVEAIKRTLQDQYTVAAHRFLQAALADDKISESKAIDLVRMSAFAYDRSGIATSPIDGLVEALSKYQKKPVGERKW
jgi:hypothetical protein